MVFKAILSNKSHPEYGTASVPFPIPSSEYDHTIELLENMDLGDTLTRDCRVDGIASSYPILNRLSAQSVNVYELDYLARRLGSFCEGEFAQFQAMASKLGLSDAKDLINLTFCCQKATVITDFSDLEKIGRQHCINLNGGILSAEEIEALDGQSVALDLIQGGAGVVTPYGVVYDNGMKLEPLYNGRHFPAYFYELPLLALEIKSRQSEDVLGYLYLPSPERQIQRTLLRAGINEADIRLEVAMDALPPHVSDLIRLDWDGCGELNEMCRAIAPLDEPGRKKLEAVVLMAQPTSINEVRHLAENLEQFDLIPGVDNPKQNSQITELGYVAYHGDLTLEELMRDEPVKQCRREMGGVL